VKVSIFHKTRYTFSRSVHLEPHIVRLYPRVVHGVRLFSHSLEVEPEPAGRCVAVDIEGNLYHLLWFEAPTAYLNLIAETEVESWPDNPLNFVLSPFSNCRLPVTYDKAQLPLVEAYLERCANTVPITAFATSIAQEVERETVPFLLQLCQRISSICERVHREEGSPYPPVQTLQELRGSCRDLAVLFIDACRAVGLAARFVSGYVLDDTSDDSRELHAWAEVFLPGAGWRAFDPSSGVAAGNEHLALATGRVSKLASPVSGTFRGTGATSSLTAYIRVARDLSHLRR